MKDNIIILHPTVLDTKLSIKTKEILKKLTKEEVLIASISNFEKTNKLTIVK